MVFTDLEIPGIEEGKLRENSAYHLRCATFVYKEKKDKKVEMLAYTIDM